MHPGGLDAGRSPGLREEDPVGGNGGRRRNAAARRRLPAQPVGLALPADAADPGRGGARHRGRRRRPRLRHIGARDHSHGGADGPRDRGARRPLRAGRRRPAQRHIRQRARADHRPLRPRQGPARGGEGLDRRLDHRQHPARARRRDVLRRPRPRAAEIQPDRRQLADDDAAARRRGAADAGDLRAGRGQGPAPAGRPGGRLRLDRRAPLAGCRDRPDRHLRRRPVLLAEDPSRPLQSRVRATRTAGAGRRAPR